MTAAGTRFLDLARVDAANGAEILAGIGLTSDALDAATLVKLGIESPGSLADLPGSAELDAFEIPAGMLVMPRPDRSAIPGRTGSSPRWASASAAR